MNEAMKYTLDFYEQQNKAYPRDIYLVIIYRDTDSPIDFSVYRERLVAEQEALKQTGASHIVEAAKDAPSLSYAIGKELMAEIHERVLI